MFRGDRLLEMAGLTNRGMKSCPPATIQKLQLLPD